MNSFLKIAAVSPTIKVADCQYNTNSIINSLSKADQQGVQIAVLPELCVCGYTCADLLSQPFFVNKCAEALGIIVEKTKSFNLLSAIGLPVAVDGRLYNCAAIIGKGTIYGLVPKTYLPNYNEFYEQRWFTAGPNLQRSEIELCGQTVPIGTHLLFETGNVVIGAEICEDMWVPIPPSSFMALAGANVLINLSASNEMVGKNEYRRQLIMQQSARNIAAYVYASSGQGESTTDLVFGGATFIAENGSILAEGERFTHDGCMIVSEIDLDKLQSQRLKTSTFTTQIQTPTFRLVLVQPLNTQVEKLTRKFNPHPFIPNDARSLNERCSEIFNIQICGLAQRFVASHSKCAVVGISGGLDSTLALLVAVGAIDHLNLPRTNIVGITMPGFGTTGRTYNNAINMMRFLGVTIREISIADACNQHFKDINLDPSDRSVTYENSQARERTQILMDVANKEGGMVVGTGDLSELALGWATYNGDHMSMYGVNASVPKTLVKHLVEWAANEPQYAAARETLLDIIDTPISPELLPADNEGKIAQKTEDLVGPYELHDFFLYNFLRFGYSPKRLYSMALVAFDGKYTADVVKKWLLTFLRRFFNQQFKRSALPDGPKVGSVSLSPRGDWRMPSDSTAQMWMSEIENL